MPLCIADKLMTPSGGFRLGPGGHRPPNLAQAPQIFDWFRSALFLLEAL